MKVKLLKKIKKEYSVKYFPAGTPIYGLGVYEVDMYQVITPSTPTGFFYETRNQCLEFILNRVREDYSHKFKKNRVSKGIKVW